MLYYALIGITIKFSFGKYISFSVKASEIMLQICINCEQNMGLWYIKCGKINACRNKISVMCEIILNL